MLQIFGDFIREQRVWSKAIKRSRIDQIKVAQPDYEEEDNEEPRDYYSDLSKEVPLNAKMLLSLRRGRRLGAIEVTLRICDLNGSILYKSSNDLGQGDIPAVYQEKAIPGEAIYQRSSDEVAIITHNFEANKSKSSRLSQELRERLLHPDQFEPLAIIYGRQLIAIAKAKSRNLVASMDDVNWRGLATNLDGKFKYTELLNRIRRRERVTETGGWLAIRSMTPIADRFNRVDRIALGDYLRRAIQAKPISIEEAAKWSLAFPRRSLHLGQRMRLLLTDSIGNIGENVIVLQFLGSLSSQQRERAKSGLAFGDLSAPQLEAVNQLLFGFIPDGFSSSGVEIKPDPNFLVARRIKEQGFPDQLKLPTEGVPNGIRPDGSVVLTVKQEESAIMELATTEERYPLNLDELGQYLFALSHPELFPNSEEVTIDVSKVKIRLGSKSTYEFTFRFNAAIILTAKLEETVIPADAPTGFENFPEAIRKLALEAKVKAEKEYRADPSRFGPSRSAKDPPPRL